MDLDVYSFTNIKVNNDLLNEIWSFDPRKLDEVGGSKLSSYAVALAQYLIYFTYQRNIVKAEQHKLSKYIDRSVSIIITDDSSYIKKYKNKSAASEFVISTNVSLMESQSKLDELQLELIRIDGMDKVISELIATIKRELTRRENELYQVRAERRN